MHRGGDATAHRVHRSTASLTNVGRGSSRGTPRRAVWAEGGGGGGRRGGRRGGGGGGGGGGGRRAWRHRVALSADSLAALGARRRPSAALGARPTPIARAPHGSITEVSLGDEIRANHLVAELPTRNPDADDVFRRFTSPGSGLLV